MTSWSIRRNSSLAVLDKLLDRLGMIDRDRERGLANDYVRKLNVATDSIDKRVINLSGGNQQKVVVAKWLATGPEILILNDPTRVSTSARSPRSISCATSWPGEGWLCSSPPRRSRRPSASATASWSFTKGASSASSPAARRPKPT